MRVAIIVSAVALAGAAAAQTQAQMNRSAGAQFDTADAHLNDTYRRVLARLGTPGKARLRDAQRAWLAFRDKQCVFVSSGADGGSAAPMIAAGCRTTLTQDRTRQLAAFTSCQDGDLSCPR